MTPETSRGWLRVDPQEIGIQTNDEGYLIIDQRCSRPMAAVAAAAATAAIGGATPRKKRGRQQPQPSTSSMATQAYILEEQSTSNSEEEGQFFQNPNNSDMTSMVSKGRRLKLKKLRMVSSPDPQ